MKNIILCLIIGIIGIVVIAIIYGLKKSPENYKNKNNGYKSVGCSNITIYYENDPKDQWFNMRNWWGYGNYTPCGSKVKQTGALGQEVTGGTTFRVEPGEPFQWGPIGSAFDYLIDIPSVNPNTDLGFVAFGERGMCRGQGAGYGTVYGANAMQCPDSSNCSGVHNYFGRTLSTTDKNKYIGICSS
jgi:hypothetical protein